MMAIAISGVIFMVLYSLLDFALASFNLGLLRSRAVQQGRITTMRILNDLKYAVDIYVADEEQILFKCPAEGDTSHQTFDFRNSSDKFHNIEYLYDPDSQTITRSDSDFGGTYTFMEGVASFSLVYRDSYLNQLTTPIAVTETHEIRYIEIDIRLQDEDYWIFLHNLAVLENPLPIVNP
jgi:hypothetical protein